MIANSKFILDSKINYLLVNMKKKKGDIPILFLVIAGLILMAFALAIFVKASDITVSSIVKIAENWKEIGAGFVRDILESAYKID